MSRYVVRLPKFTALLALTAALAGCGDSTSASSKITYKATLLGTTEVPANASTATGTMTITVDEAKNMVYTLTFSGLSSGTLAAHIHGPAAAGTNAAPILPLNITTGVTAGTIGPTSVSLTSTLTGVINADSLITLMNTGNAYVNVHTTQYTGGEIRGWLVRQ